MALKYADSVVEWTVPQDTKRSYLRADASFARPGDGMSYLDGHGDWTGPQMGTPADKLPVGTPGNDTLVEFLSIWGEPIVWRVIGQNLPGMPADSVTLLSDKIIAILPFDARELNSPDQSHAGGGNNDWTVSNLRQWLNSDKGSGQWYAPQHQYDRPPDEENITAKANFYDTFAGFLNGATDVEKRVLLETERVIGYLTNNNKTCKDKIFLFTSSEYGIKVSYASGENGTEIPYFSSDAMRQAYPTAKCITHDNSSIHSLLSTQKPWRYWTATSPPLDGADVVCIDDAGSIFSYSSSASNVIFGVRPACNIKSSTRFSPEPNGAGHYTLI